MPPTCRACRSPRAAEIASLLVAGTPLRDIAGLVGLSKSALDRHRPHVGLEVIRAIEIRKDDEAETLLQKVERIERNAARLAEKAESQNDVRGAVVANRALLDVIRLLVEMVPSSERAEPVAISFSFRNGMSAWNADASGGATLPVAEVTLPATGAELASPASGIPEVVVPAPPNVEPETEEAKFVREAFERLDKLREQDDAEPRSALIEPRYEPRRGGF